MKLVHIAGIVVLGIAIAFIVVMYDNSSQYVSFEGAEKLAMENPNKSYHVVVELNKEKPMVYDPRKDPNHFEFFAIDSLGIERLVIFEDSKPADFDRTDKIVIQGMAREGYFEAKEILLKCPSKYNEEITSTESN